MASTILSDNGVSSGSAGIKTTADGTGALALQTTTAAGAATTALTLDTSQNATFVGTATATKLIPTGSSVTGNGLYLPAANSLGLSTNGTNAVYIDSSQNVGIGTASPSGRLNLAVGAATSCTLRLTSNNTGTGAGDRGRLDFYSADNSGTAYQLGYMDYDRSDGTGTASYIAWANRVSGTVAERMRITSGGNLLLNTTTDPGGSAKLGIKGAGTTNATVGFYVVNSASSDSLLLYDDQSVKMGTTGSAPYNNTTATGANAVFAANGFLQRSTSSLKYKTDIQDATHGLTDLLKLRSVTYKGKSDGDIIFGGLIAEEVDAAGLNEFVQYAADGSPDALAYGNMVSLCVKAIQEQQALITALTARIETLENKT